MAKKIPRKGAHEWEERIADLVFAELASRGCNISAEHGIDQRKRRSFHNHKDPLQIRLMEQIKKNARPE